MATSNAGPLTTTFTAPWSSCATATGVYQVWPGDGTHYYQQGPLLDNRPCFPSGYSTERFYSPGVCPSGYTAACSSVNTARTATETAYTCCPTAAEYSCAETGNASRPFLGCTTLFENPWVIVSVTAVADGSSYPVSSALESPGSGIGAHSIEVRFQSSDLVKFASPTSSGWTTLSTAAASPSLPRDRLTTLVIPAPTRQASAKETPETQAVEKSDTAGNVSRSAAAGIGVGSAALALLLAGIAATFVLWIRRRRRRARRRPPAVPPKDKLPSIRGHIRGPYELHVENKLRAFHEVCGQSSPRMIDPLRCNPLTPYHSPHLGGKLPPAELETPARVAVLEKRLAELESP